MWKHVPASEPIYTFKEGDRIRIRTGNQTTMVLTLVRLGNGKLIWRKPLEGNYYSGGPRSTMTRGGMSGMPDFYGRTIDVFHEEEVTCNVKEVPPNTLVLVGKAFTKLVDGLRMVFKPYTCNPDKIEFTAVVSRHGCGNHAGRANCIQVHVQRGGKPYTTITLTGNLDSKTVQDLTFFNKHSCYLVKNYQKAEAKTTERLCPNGAKAIPERDTDKGQFIVWCPSSHLPPRVVHNSEKQAKAVAASMSERHGKKFHWCRIIGTAEQVSRVVTKTVKETKITEL